jgi:hypothetical protein
MSANQEAFRAAVAAANAAYAAAVAAAEAGRQATTSIQAAAGLQFGLDDASNAPPVAVGGLVVSSPFSSVVAPAGITKQQAIQAAEQIRQGAIAAAKDLLQSQGELPY